MQHHFINGQWTPAANGETLPVIDPSTGEVFDQIARGTALDIDHAVKAARAALNGPWGGMTATERGRILSRMSALILERHEELSQLESRDTGKPLTQARTDITGAARAERRHRSGRRGRCGADLACRYRLRHLHRLTRCRQAGAEGRWRAADQVRAQTRRQVAADRVRRCRPEPRRSDDLEGHHAERRSDLLGRQPAAGAAGHLRHLHRTGEEALFTDEEDAIRLANATDFGLLAGIWTRDGARQIRMAKRMHCGQVYLNCYGAGAGVELPFGGVKKSGHGREKGFLALEEFCVLKTVVQFHGE